MQSGLIYFKDWNSGTLTYRDPRQSATLSTQRIGLMSISLSPEEVIDVKSPSNASARSVKRKTVDQFTSMVEHSLELSLNLPGTPSPVSRPGSSSQDGSVCTMEKVRSALERSPWLSQSHRLNLQMAKKKCSTGTPSSDPTKLLLASRPSSSSRKSSSPSRLHLESGSKSESAATSQCSSECFTSPSVMSFQGTHMPRPLMHDLSSFTTVVQSPLRKQNKSNNIGMLFQTTTWLKRHPNVVAFYAISAQCCFLMLFQHGLGTSKLVGVTVSE